MPSIAITQPYEAVYIVDADSGEERLSAITTKYRQIVETGGGTIEKIDVWERRRLAYEIKGRTEGIYVVMQFRSKPPVEAELRRIFQISEDQIRFLIIRRDDDEALLPLAEAAPAAPAAAPTPAPVAEPVAAETVMAAETPAAEAVAETPTETPTETPIESTETVEAPAVTEAEPVAA